MQTCLAVEGEAFLCGGPFGAEPGLLSVLGVDPTSIFEVPGMVGASDSSFVAPSEVS